MSQPPVHARHEMKFVSFAGNLALVLNWVKMNPGMFFQPYPDRWVNNVYFDSYHYGAFQDNLTGVSQRTKIRYRWYGQSLQPGPGRLEVKKKRNLYGWKLTQNIKERPYVAGNRWRDVQSNLLNSLDADKKIWLQENPFPILINQYHRRYFISEDQKIRITVDTKQMVFDQRYKSVPNFKRQALISETLILEVKFDRQDNQLGSELIDSLPIRVSRNSKYAIGAFAIRD